MRIIIFTISLLLISQTSAQQPTEAKLKSDLELLQGNWEIVGLESGGKDEVPVNYKGNRFTFTKEKAILREWGYSPIEYTFTLDSSKSPKTIDLTVKNSTLRGIYKLDNDELVLCLSMAGARPTEFMTKTGGDCERIAMKRSKWEKFADKTLGYSVELPGKPEERTRKLDSSTGQLACSLRLVRGDNERANYLVSILQLPRTLGDKDEKELEEMKEVLKKAMLSEIGATASTAAKSAVEPKLNTNTAREWTITADVTGSMNKITARIRWFAVGDKLFGLMATGGEEVTRSRTVGLFLNSFVEPTPAKP